MTNNEKNFEIYFDTIRKSNKSATEYTHRTAMENLLNAIKSDKTFHVLHEPKKSKDDEGKPDFQVFKNGLLIGYMEMKPVGTDLDEIMEKDNPSRESKQLQRYLKVSPTLILSNYTDFVLFQNGIKVKMVMLFDIKDKALDVEKVKKTSELFGAFFLSKPQEVTSPEKLSMLLAERTKIFKDLVDEVINNSASSPFKDKLIGTDGLYDVLKKTLIDDLSLDEFADAYVQTITYGLILARLNAPDSIAEVTAPTYIPKSIGTIRELFKTIEIEEIPSEIGWIIGAIIVILNSIDRKRFDEILSFKKSYTYEDPYVYFYEKFLAEYDKKKRKAMGVYYTPIPVVWYIIKSINQLLRKEFRVDGLKEPDVTLLDFATGTGTFLLEAYKKAIDDTDKGTRPRLIKEHLLKHFYGFEYLIAPYTVAHLKLSQFMKDNGYELGDSERINVYLTDTLDNDLHKRYAIFPKISEEGEEAYKIKLKQPILVVTGNPPYSNHSRNNKPWIKELIKTYKEGLEGEGKINLDDDYIKFLRYAQWKIEQSGKGIIGVITNNSYLGGLGGITHREMRHKLLQAFDKIYILNLHGNSNKGETDKNVFDIKVGVAITLFVKLEKPAKEKEVYYYSITEDGKAITRKEKYDFLMNHDYSKIDWKQLAPKEPNYWFVKKDDKYESLYNKGVSLTEIFDIWGSGFETDRDELFVDFDKNILEGRIKLLLSGGYDTRFKERYRVEDSSSYPILKRIKSHKFNPKAILPLQYRLFDYRYVYYEVGITSRPVYEVMEKLLENTLSLAVVRQIVSSSWQHVFVTNFITEGGLLSSKTSERTYIMPLYSTIRKSISKQAKINGENPKGENAYRKRYPNANFKDDFEEFIAIKYSFIPTPEEIFGYIYAILYSPTYRKKFYEFLKEGYPKITFTDDESKFKKLSKLGLELIDLHLLKISKVDPKIAEFKEKYTDYLEKPSYDDKTHKIYINETQYFDNVPPELWNLEIGGYRVLFKWLNERKGMALSYEAQNQFKKIVYALKETLKLMEQIDELYKSK